MDITYPPLPSAVYHDQVFDAIRLLGFEPKDVVSIHIEKRAITIACPVRNEHGHYFVAGAIDGEAQIAKVIFQLPISNRSLVDPFIPPEPAEEVTGDTTFVDRQEVF